MKILPRGASAPPVRIARHAPARWRPSRILLCSVSAGAGHVRAAAAVEAAITAVHPGVEVRHIDAMDFVPRAFRRLYVDGYVAMVNRAPSVWGMLYNAADRQPPGSLPSRLVSTVQRVQAPRLLKFLADWRPDAVLATHFFLPQVLSASAFARQLAPRIEVVVTDFDVHRIWLQDGVDRYHVATDVIAHKLNAWGVARDRVEVVGIPIHPAFAAPVAREQARTDLGLDPNLPTILLLAGGLGMGALDRTVTMLAASGRPLQIVSVAGRNESLRKVIASCSPPPGGRIVSLGFVENMPQLLDAADLVVTKPGGLTTSEALARGAALLLASPIPGQEERNADYLLENGAAMRASCVEELQYKALMLLGDDQRRNELRAAARALGRPEAAFRVAGRLVEAARLEWARDEAPAVVGGEMC